MLIEWTNRAMVGRHGRSADEHFSIDTDDDPRGGAFRPVTCARPRVLTGGQVEAFNRDGFVSPVDVFDEAETARHRAYITNLADAVVAAPDRRNQYSIINYHIACKGLYDITQTPRLLDAVSDLLGPEVVCWNTHLFFKTGNDPMEVPLHQDFLYWPLQRAGSVTAWLAFDEVDAGNGAVGYVAGSHRGGLLKHVERSLDGSRSLKREVVSVRDRALHVNALHPGQVSLHSDLIVHGSSPNTSGRPRMGLAIRYASPDVQPLPGAEWYLKALVGCRSSSSGALRGRRPPRNEHPELFAEVWGEFDGVAYQA